MSRENDSISYRIGMFFGSLIHFLFVGIFKILWDGTVTLCKKDKYYIIAYGILLTWIIVIAILYNNFSIMIGITLAFAFCMGMYLRIKDYPNTKMRKKFNKIFEQIGLMTKDEKIPYFLFINREKYEYVTVFAFKTLVPLSVWENKKELMEMYMNVKIVFIRQSKKDNQIIWLYVKKQDLPTTVPWNDKYTYYDNDILVIGLSYFGLVGMDLEQYPHCFIAGETGSGKSNIMKCMIHQALLKKYKVVIIDFKRGVSFSDFSNEATIHYEYSTVKEALEEMVEETKNRLDLFREHNVDNLKDYNNTYHDNLPRIIIFIDELAELLKGSDKETSKILNGCIETLTRLSRATGIHLIMGIQRPDSTIISGQIKNNVSYRICGRFVDVEPSRIMLGCDVASKLDNIKGRFIVKENELFEVQSFYFTGHKKYIPLTTADLLVGLEPKPKNNNTNSQNLISGKFKHGVNYTWEEVFQILEDNKQEGPKKEPPEISEKDKMAFDFSDIIKK